MTTTLARRTDPITSHIAAADHVKSVANDKQKFLVLTFLRRYVASLNRYPTSAELADKYGMDRHMVANRLPDLEKAGLVAKDECMGQLTKRVCCEICGKTFIPNHVQGLDYQASLRRYEKKQGDM